MKSGAVLVFALLCRLTTSEVYFDQSGYGYGVNPVPSGLSEARTADPIATDLVAPQESKPQAYLVRLKPKEAQDSSSSPSNKKSKFLLLLRLPEDQEDTQATSLNSEVQQKDESVYPQSDDRSQTTDYSSAYSPSFENQKDEVDQYQQQQQQQQQQPQQQQQDETDSTQQNDSGYLQPLQTGGYGQQQNVDQVQQKDDAYSQQQQPQQQQQQQQDIPEEYEQQGKDDSGYEQQQPQQQQQNTGYGQMPVPVSNQFQVSAFKNGFSPLPNYERPAVQNQQYDSVKGSRNNFFRSPVLQDSVKTVDNYGQSDSQSSSTDAAYDDQRDAVKSPVQTQSALPSYSSVTDSGRKSGSYLGASQGSVKSPSTSSYPAPDASKSEAPTSSYPSQRFPMKSPAQVYAQQQQQIEQTRKTVSSPVRDFYGPSEKSSSNSYNDQQQGFSSYGSNEESVKSAVSPTKDSYNYGSQQEEIKAPVASLKTPPASLGQSYGKTRTEPVVDDYSNSYNSPLSSARAPAPGSSSFAPLSGYAAQQQYEQQPQQQQQQQQQQQDDYNQPAQDEDDNDSQENDEQSRLTSDQQQNGEPEKKVPVILISLPPESSPFSSGDNQQKDEGVEPQQQIDSQQKSDSDYQQSSGPSEKNYQTNLNAPVKGQASPSSGYEKSSLQAKSYGQQSESSYGTKSMNQRFPTKSSSFKPVQQTSVDFSSSYSSGSPASAIKEVQSPQQSTYDDNKYSNDFQSSPKDTKSVQSTSSYSNDYPSSTVKGGRDRQSVDSGYSNEQKQAPLASKGAAEPTKTNVQLSYSSVLQTPVKAARAFQKSTGYSSEYQSSSKGGSDSYSKQQQSSVDSGFADLPPSPVQQKSQPEQQKTQSDSGLGSLKSSTKGGRAQTQISSDSGYQSASKDSSYQPSSVKGADSKAQKQATSFGYSSAFITPQVQQTSSGFESNSYQNPAEDVKGAQRSPVQQQQVKQTQSDAYSFPNPSSQPAYASFAASVKGSDDAYSSGFQAPVAPVVQSASVKGGQQQTSEYSDQSIASYEPSSSGIKSAPTREPKVALVIPTYRTKSGRSQLSLTKSPNPTSSYNQQSASSGFSAAPLPSQQILPSQPLPQQQQSYDTKSPVKSQSNTKSLLSYPSTTYLPALSPVNAVKSPPQIPSAPTKSSTQSDPPSYFSSSKSLPPKQQQQYQQQNHQQQYQQHQHQQQQQQYQQQQFSQSMRSLPLNRGLPPPPALVARSRPSQSFNFPSTSVQPTDSYPSYSASSNNPVFDDEEDAMSITADGMGAYGLRTNSPYDAATASATSHLRAVEQPQGSGRVVLLVFDKGQINSQQPQMAFNANSHGVYQ